VVELLEEVEPLLPLVLAEVAVEVAVEVVDLQSAPSAATPAILTQSAGRSTMTRHLLVGSGLLSSHGTPSPKLSMKLCLLCTI